MDSIDPIYAPSGSRLLSESPLSAAYQSSSHTGPGGDDLSLSELDFTRPTQPERPFSLFARLQTPPPQPNSNGDDNGGDAPTLEEAELGSSEEDQEQRARSQARTREEKLQNDLFVLRKLNATFGVYNDALRETESATEVRPLFRSVVYALSLFVNTYLYCILGYAKQRVAAQLEQTDALLNKYVNVMAKSERIARLMFDERWEGAEAVDNSCSHGSCGWILILGCHFIGRGRDRTRGTRKGRATTTRGGRTCPRSSARKGA